MIHLIVYLRDPADLALIEPRLRERLPDLPIAIVKGSVCRPEWLIEVEGVAIANAGTPTCPGSSSNRRASQGGKERCIMVEDDAAEDVQRGGDPRRGLRRDPYDYAYVDRPSTRNGRTRCWPTRRKFPTAAATRCRA